MLVSDNHMSALLVLADLFLHLISFLYKKIQKQQKP